EALGARARRPIDRAGGAVSSRQPPGQPAGSRQNRLSGSVPRTDTDSRIDRPTRPRARCARVGMRQLVERSPLMRCRSFALLLLILPGSPVLAQGVISESPHLLSPGVALAEDTGACPTDHCAELLRTGGEGRFASNRNFPNFIGWMSDPLQNIDPRSL